MEYKCSIFKIWRCTFRANSSLLRANCLEEKMYEVKALKIGQYVESLGCCAKKVKKNKWAFEHNFCTGSGNLNELIFKSSKPGGAWGGC